MAAVTDPKTGQPIYSGNPGTSLRQVGNYQVSAVPFATASIGLTTATDNVQEVDFPSVTQWFQVINESGSQGAVRVGFSENGVNGEGIGHSNNYFVLNGTDDLDHGASTTPILRLKVRSIFLRAESGTPTVSVVAGLTNIQHNLSASSGVNWSGSVGVG